MSDLGEPFQFDFMVRAMVAATLVGALTGCVGVYVVLRAALLHRAWARARHLRRSGGVVCVGD